MTGLEIGILAALAVGATYATWKAGERQDQAAKRSNRVRMASATEENLRSARRAIAQRRVQQAELIAQSQSENTGKNSAVQGAVNSLTTQTASNIGFANSKLASEYLSNKYLMRGQRQVNNWQTTSSLFSTAFSAYGASVGTGTK